MTYPFLFLCLLLWIPAAIVFALRADLRRPMGIVAFCAVPFAFTEFLFYPTYWEPRFLFDLVHKIGFGIEDILFVTGLGAMTSVAYPTVFNKRLITHHQQSSSVIHRALAVTGAALILTGIVALAGVPMIWGCVPIMGLMAGVMVWIRRDLAGAVLWGSLLNAVAYYAICLFLAAAVPDVFELNWHAEQFSNIYLTGVPIEEIAYAAGAGAVASVFYPFIFSMAYRTRKVKVAGYTPK
ncbi:MAG: hypothetical protein JXX14_10790 [Deltaproteobacteria bacterium]|nr:hypothetical protein [Deltaproteobacteria bacterium]